MSPTSASGFGYRAGEIRSLCETCGEFANAPCIRCGRPFCARHTPLPAARCDRCEALFVRRSRRWVAGSTFLMQLGISAPYLVIGWPSVDSEKWQQRVRSWARKRFLKERPRRGRPR